MTLSKLFAVGNDNDVEGGVNYDEEEVVDEINRNE